MGNCPREEERCERALLPPRLAAITLYKFQSCTERVYAAGHEQITHSSLPQPSKWWHDVGASILACQPCCCGIRHRTNSHMPLDERLPQHAIYPKSVRDHAANTSQTWAPICDTSRPPYMVIFVNTISSSLQGRSWLHSLLSWALCS